MLITQSQISSFGSTRIYKPAGTETTAPSNSGGWRPSSNPVYPNTANGYYAELRVTTSSNVNLVGYQAKYTSCGTRCCTFKITSQRIRENANRGYTQGINCFCR